MLRTRCSVQLGTGLLSNNFEYILFVSSEVEISFPSPRIHHVPLGASERLTGSYHQHDTSLYPPGWVLLASNVDLSLTNWLRPRWSLRIRALSCTYRRQICSGRGRRHGAKYDAPIAPGRRPRGVPPPPDPWPFARDGRAVAAWTTATGDKRTGEETNSLYENGIFYHRSLETSCPTHLAVKKKKKKKKK